MTLDLPVPAAPPVDFEGKARKELNAALALAKAAADVPPWDHRKHGYWRVVFPQMSNWLPEDERTPLVAEFRTEWDRIDRMFNEVKGDQA